MRVKIVSDGRVSNTRIVDAETGEDINYVTAIDWHIDVKTLVATAVVTFLKVPVDVVGEMNIEP